MHESLQLFKQVVNNKYFVNTSVILFLNKIDLFQEKIVTKKRSLAIAFEAFSGESTSSLLSRACAYVRLPPLSLFVLFWPSGLRRCVQVAVLSGGRRFEPCGQQILFFLNLNFTLKSFSGPYEDWEKAVEFVEKKYRGMAENKEKNIYCHQTCATDTQQVQYVLDAVLDTILSSKLKGCGLY